MINLFTRRAATIVGSAAMLWIVPASAADLAVTACDSFSGELRSAVTGKKPLTTARISSALRPAQRGRTASPQPERQASTSERNYSDIWYRRQFVLLVGIAY
jgi:hypothetical protein